MDANTVPDTFPVEGNVLVWNTSSETDATTSHQYQADPEWEWSRRRRSSSSVKHPLLAKLKEIDDDDDVKHSDYTIHVLIQKQIGDYAFAVEGVIDLLKTGSEKILDNVAFWKGQPEGEPALKENTLKPSWMSFTFTAKNGNELDITQIGRNIVQISETLKKVQENEKDALIFWTSEHRVAIFKILVALAKDLVKFRRKLARIRDTLGDRLRNVRRTAIQCECEISGNIVPTEIYYQWVKEDAEVFKANQSSSANISTEKEIGKPKGKSKLKKTAKNIISCFHSNGNSEDDDDQSSDVSSSDERDYKIDFDNLSLNKMSPLVKVYEIRKDIEFLLRREMSEIFKEDDASVCDPSLESFVENAKLGPGRNAGPAPVRIKQSERREAAATELDEVWAAKPSQRYLDAIASNISPKQKFRTPHYVYDRVESKIKESFKIEGNELPYPMSDEDLEDEARANALQSRSQVPPLLSSTSSSSEDQSLKSRQSFSTIAQEESEDDLQAGPEIVIPRRILSDEMMRHITASTQIVEAIHDSVTEAMWTVRGLERTWLSTPENVSQDPNFFSKKAFIPPPPKELYQLLDFIVETANLTNSPEFSNRIYPEDRDEIVSVLDPVLKELTTCYMNIYVLHNLVAVDGKYLQELVSGFPKGNLVVRDWMSDPSIDEELELHDVDVDQDHHIKEFHVDVDELFA